MHRTKNAIAIGATLVTAALITTLAIVDASDNASSKPGSPSGSGTSAPHRPGETVESLELMLVDAEQVASRLSRLRGAAAANSLRDVIFECRAVAESEAHEPDAEGECIERLRDELAAARRLLPPER